MVIAKWQGERDDERFQAVLRDPSIVDRQVELALRGEDLDDDGRPDGYRGGREREREPVGAGS